MPATSQKELSIDDLIKGNLKLASPPNIYFELQKTIEDSTKSFVDAAYIVEKDAALAIRLLKIVNSAFFGFPSKITSIDRAITLIGSKELQNIVLSTAVIDKFSGFPNELVNMQDFWATNLRCALIAKELDKHLNAKNDNVIFMCGLLHHVGRLVFYRRIPELAREVKLMMQAQVVLQADDEHNFEQQIIGFNHYQVGAALTKLWKLPEIITESIRLHPYPDNTDQFFKIAAIVRTADCYCKIENDNYSEVIYSLDISPVEISMIFEKVQDQFEEIFRVFYPA
jgi:HD-like signal output (HDOD) protein